MTEAWRLQLMGCGTLARSPAENAANMEQYTADKLRRDFIEPLTELVAQLTGDVRKFENAVANGDLPRDYLPLNHIQASACVARLRRFRREEVSAKLEAAIEGSLRYREAELEAGRKKRSVKKRSK